MKLESNPTNWSNGNTVKIPLRTILTDSCLISRLLIQPLKTFHVLEWNIFQIIKISKVLNDHLCTLIFHLRTLHVLLIHSYVQIQRLQYWLHCCTEMVHCQQSYLGLFQYLSHILDHECYQNVSCIPSIWLCHQVPSNSQIIFRFWDNFNHKR